VARGRRLWLPAETTGAQLPQSKRTRGSAQPMSTSEMKVPTSVNELRIMTMLPRQRNPGLRGIQEERADGGQEKHHLDNDPAGKDAGNAQPMVLKMGLMATRTGYLKSSLLSARPLARAVST